DQITTLFETTIRNIPAIDLWQHGRSSFRDTVHHHILHYTPIPFILPAFPCKSSNLAKVSGVAPDKGEELALRTLYDFCLQVDEIYAPGGRVIIVSDGHVFSDLIGVDDEVVDTYGQLLAQMRTGITGPSDQHLLQFLSLPDLLQPSNFPTALLPKSEPQTLVSTTHTPEADLCRTILTSTCGTTPSTLRSELNDPTSPTLALYRGFSKFMLEDLSTHPSFTTLSKKQQKKTASKVAWEMVLRNQAYSNLVEALFPFAVRLSIHAHSNAGPKFGIRMLQGSVKVVRNLRSILDGVEGGEEEAGLHVPTPWHNVVCRVTGREGWVVCKRSVLLEGVKEGRIKMGWVEGHLEAGEGGYYVIEK
ncbi:hypothetical protein BJ508DRAFT_192692, partial [Ascobolus immersus RN42]